MAGNLRIPAFRNRNACSAANQFSDEFIHFPAEDDCNIRTLLEMMVIEYAYKREDTQDILKPMTLSFIMYIARQYTQQYKETVP